MPRSDLTVVALPVPAPSHVHEGGSTQHEVERSPGGAGQSVDPRVSHAREARRRAVEKHRAAQEATRRAQLAHEEADASGERATLLEATYLARLTQKSGTGDPRICR